MQLRFFEELMFKFALQQAGERKDSEAKLSVFVCSPADNTTR
jgi:hypothetical protein